MLCYVAYYACNNNNSEKRKKIIKKQVLNANLQKLTVFVNKLHKAIDKKEKKKIVYVLWNTVFSVFGQVKFHFECQHSA